MPLAATRHLLGIAAPPRCACCGEDSASVETLCSTCLEELAVARPVLEAGPRGVELAVAAGPYNGIVRELAHRLKFGRRLGLAGLAAEAIAAACPPGSLDGTLVPVPPSPWRRRWRGFDPAEEIALALAHVTGLPLARCLRRSPGPRQVGRTRADRVADPPRVRPRRRVPAAALLVDDVHTTGATLAACAAALRASGCTRVVALTLARSR
ncbi:MAG TPA: hypothetical protein VHH72_09420 [Solirubrobacterales bacterium]|nr:hypothetical protein [Solirubrobacterales bacterium]